MSTHDGPGADGEAGGDALHEQLIDLQARIAYQEHTLLELDRALADQAARIGRLEQRLTRLAERMESALDPGDAPPADEPPPHY